MAFDPATEQALMKETYPEGIVELDYQRSKTLRLIRKNKGSLEKTPFGKGFIEPVRHGNPQAGSATYATGYNQSTTEQSRHDAWNLLPAENFHFAELTGKMIRRSEGDGSFVKAGTYEIERAKDAFHRILEVSLFKGGFGNLFQLSAAANVAVATNVLLAQPWMVRHVEKGQKFVFAASESGHVLKGTTSIKVTGRSVSAGTLNFDAAPNQAGTLAAASDFGFRDGDRENSATPARLMLTGFPAWLPPAAPSATLFHGVNRTVDDRLGGLRHDATTSGSPEEAFMDADTAVNSEGGQCSHYVCGPNTFNKLAKSMATHIEHVTMEVDEMPIGIQGFRIKGSDAIVYWDNACEEGNAFGFNIDEVELRYAGKALMYIEEYDGLFYREVAGTDNWKARLVSSPQLVLPAPGHGINLFNL
jgi:hypothetical protein